jgi:hypothetical protein
MGRHGEICGMFYFADVTATLVNFEESYLIYADAFDELIDAGWKVAQNTAAAEVDEEIDAGKKVVASYVH